MDNHYEITLESVKNFVSENLGADKNKLTEQTKIEEDLGIAGLDTITFYETFFDKFKISNPSDFNVDEYITSENLEIGAFFKSLFSKSQRNKTKNNTIQHLTHVAMKQKWYTV